MLVLVQGTVLLAVNTANVSNARQHAAEALGVTAAAFMRSIQVRNQILLEKAHLCSSDFAFKEASTGDHATLLSALENHQARVGANVMMLISMQHKVMASTLHPGTRGGTFSLSHIIEDAMENEFGEASSIDSIDGRPYQLVVVPLFTPEPSAWILIGFHLDDAFARELREETGTQVSLLRRESGGNWRPFASTLAPGLRASLVRRLSVDFPDARLSVSMAMEGREFVSRIVPVGVSEDARVIAVLQRSLEEALRPYMRLRTILLLIFAVGLLASLAGGIVLAGRVSRPVAVLADGARRIREGDYGHAVRIEQQDELGMLATSFNHMTQGLAERDRVRDLLGKVVSPAIADELLSKGIELGGEERTVSVLFSDIRDFTSLSESESPQGLVALLNIYLTRMSAIVEHHGGVVDKYIGDAVMALFGAPLQHTDDAMRSVQAAMEMCRSLDQINAEIVAQESVPLAIGVGINTGAVVAGRMGSRSRLNYTVIGDAVNLASRLEGLTKHYGVKVIVSESTATACPGIVFRELDRVRVKGRTAPVSIFEPVGIAADVDPSITEELRRYHEALARFRGREWDEAAAIFRTLERTTLAPVYALYLRRIAHFRETAPGPDWDGAVQYDEK